jgi:hypothetical protein
VNCTDRIRRAASGGADSAETATVGKTLADVAGHLAACRPDDLLTTDAMPVCVSAAVYNDCERGTSTRTLRARIQAALQAAPEPEPRTTRGRYADVLRKTAAEHGWTEEDNKPAIPRIPGPRREEPAPAPRSAAAPVGGCAQ